MFFYIKLSFRNLMRNKRRALIAGSAIGIGLAALIFVDALIIGMQRNMIRSATASFLGEGQIHAVGFRESFATGKTILRLNELLESLEQETLVDRLTRRVLVFGMITSPADLSAVTMVGIDPAGEPYLSQIDEALVEGRYLVGDDERGLMLGRKLAEILQVKIGSRVVMTVAEAHSGDLSQEMFRVSGIFNFNVNEMDRGMVFVPLDTAQRMLNIGDEVHEIALTLHPSESDEDTASFWRKYSRDENEAVSWAELMPQLKAALDMSRFFSVIIGAILFAVVALGIVNTLFMSLHERVFEFGVLRAVGTRPMALARLILFEAGALAVLSMVLGVALGWTATFITTKTGIDYTGIEFVGVTFRELLYPVFHIQQFTVYPIIVCLFTVAVAVYPAMHAARMSPADAMRRSF